MNSVDTSTGRLLLKHSMSRADDAELEYAIDWSSKALRLVTAAQDGRPFLPTALLESFMTTTLPEDWGIRAWDDDASGSRSDWTTRLIVGNAHFAVKLIKQVTISPGMDRWTLDLYPMTENTVRS